MGEGRSNLFIQKKTKQSGEPRSLVQQILVWLQMDLCLKEKQVQMLGRIRYFCLNTEKLLSNTAGQARLKTSNMWHKKM